MHYIVKKNTESHNREQQPLRNPSQREPEETQGHVRTSVYRKSDRQPYRKEKRTRQTHRMANKSLQNRIKETTGRMGEHKKRGRNKKRKHLHKDEEKNHFKAAVCDRLGREKRSVATQRN